MGAVRLVLWASPPRRRPRPLSILSSQYPILTSANSSTHFFHLIMSHPSSSQARLQLLFDAALQSYEKQTGFKLIDHPFARQLESCHTAESVMNILQHQAWSITGFREDDGKSMRSLKRVVHVLHALSTSTTLGEGISLVRLTQLLFSQFLMLVL